MGRARERSRWRDDKGKSQRSSFRPSPLTSDFSSPSPSLPPSLRGGRSRRGCARVARRVGGRSSSGGPGGGAGTRADDAGGDDGDAVDAGNALQWAPSGEPHRCDVPFETFAWKDCLSLVLLAPPRRLLLSRPPPTLSDRKPLIFELGPAGGPRRPDASSKGSFAVVGRRGLPPAPGAIEKSDAP